jgi:hypothetical protein
MMQASFARAADRLLLYAAVEKWDVPAAAPTINRQIHMGD